MGKISNYTRVLKAKLQDVFAIDSTDNNVTTTKSVTVEQIGDAICGEQVHADLETEQQTIIDSINEVNDKADTNATNIGDLSSLTTTNKDSLVEAVNSMVIKTNAAWTANSSSAYGTTLTDSINVTAGVWIITWGHPSQSANLGCYIDGITTNSDISEQFMTIDNGLAYTKGCILVRFTGNSTIKLCAAGSASVSFSDIGRGFLRAVKLK